MKTKTYQRTPAELFVELELDTVTDKVLHLQENVSFGLATLLQLAFSPNIKLELPEGPPPYKTDTSPPDRTLNRYDNAIRDIGACVVENKIPSFKKEKVFIQILESVSEKDALILIAAKDKKLTELYPILTKELVEKAFPTLLQ
jgi:hypothetical protein